MLTSPKCLQRHRPSACDRFKGLSLHHRQSVIAAKELCARCLRHSDLDTVKVSECIRRNTPPHWLGSDVRDPDAQPRAEVELPPVEAKAGSIVWACRTTIRMKVESDSHAESYSAELSTLFSTKRQMSVIALGAAIGQELLYRTVPEVEVMLGDGRRDKSSRLFFLEVRPHRVVRPLRIPTLCLMAAYGVSEVAPVAEAAQELPLLRERFSVRPLWGLSTYE